ncbi:hypothetical protein AB0J47_37320 [Nocardia sp. NPDC049737]|uniref:hypothetical protein n=1 Tax=Nocardia sp. NPDC049737 TaxID=3154358 RepID=UPI003412EA3B
MGDAVPVGSGAGQREQMTKFLLGQPRGQHHRPDLVQVCQLGDHRTAPVPVTVLHIGVELVTQFPFPFPSPTAAASHLGGAPIPHLVDDALDLPQ